MRSFRARIELLEDRRLLAGAPPFLDGVEVGAIETDRVKEPSGLVVSRKNIDVIWTHNDSGGNPELFAVDTTGRFLGAYNLVDANLVDWEDIAIGPGPIDGVDYLYIADTGDNAARYDSVFIYRVPEPVVDSQQQPADFDLTEVERFEFVYPDGARDAETLLVDPISGDVVIVSKRETKNEVYVVTQQQLDQLTGDEPHTLDLLGTMTWGNKGGLTGAVAGDVSADGSEILIKNYDEIFYYSRLPGTSLAEAIIDVEPLTVPYTRESKGESVAFDSHTGGYYTLNEISDQELTFYEPDVDVTPPLPRFIAPLDNGPEDVNPAAGELFVALPSVLQIQLVDQEVDDTTVTPAVLSMTRLGNPFDAFTFAYDAASDVITLTPEGDTFLRGRYEITISPAGSVIADVEGNQTPETTLVVEVSVGLPTVPVANPDAYVLTEDDQLDVGGTEGILDNDDAAFNTPFVPVLVDAPQHGTLELSDEGGVIYVPEADFSGSDRFTYFIRGRFFDSEIATVTFTVEPVNDRPIAEDDAYRIVQGEVLEAGSSAAAPERIAGTGFQEPNVGAQRYTAGTGGNEELGFDGTVIPNGSNEVAVRDFGDGDQQLLVHDGRVLIRTDLVDVSEYEQVQVAIDLRTWETSNGSDFERDQDFIRVFVEASENGVDFSEIDVTPGTLTGGGGRDDPQDQLKALGSDENGPLTTFGVDIPEQFTSLRVVIDAENTSASERFTFDNILISGIAKSAGRRVLNNDLDVDRDPLTAVLVDPPNHGTLELQPNGAFIYTPNDRFVGDDTFTYRASDGQIDSELATVTITVEPPTEVVGRSLFYNDSVFVGDAAIAPDKSALLPGQTASFANYTSFVHGLNGIIIDVQRLASTTLDESSFELRAGNTRDPSTWPLADSPAITVRPGAGEDNSDRITLVWANDTLTNTWLEVTLKAGDATGLQKNDVFFFGNAIGDVGRGNLPGVVLVDGVDRATVRQNRSDVIPAAIDSPFDINRDGLVNNADLAIVRQNRRNFLSGLVLLTAPMPAAPAPPAQQFAVVGPLAASADSPVGRDNRRVGNKIASEAFFERLGRRADDKVAIGWRAVPRRNARHGASLRRLQAAAVDRSIEEVDLSVRLGRIPDAIRREDQRR